MQQKWPTKSYTTRGKTVNVSNDFKEIVNLLLEKDPQKRIGHEPLDEGANKILEHKFF